MVRTGRSIETSRKRQLLVPIAAMTLGALALLVAMVSFLVNRFDDTALAREQRMVESGFSQHVKQIDDIPVPQVDWDRAVAKADRKVDPSFADIEFGEQLYTFDGFSHSFLVSGDNRVTYAYIRGNHATADAFAPFWPTFSRLIGSIRTAEAKRGPIRPHAEGQGMVARPIQANGLVRVDGQVYLIIISLIQPDLGKVQPLGPRSSVLVNAVPVGQAMLNDLAARYMLDGLSLADQPPTGRDKAWFALHGTDGQVIGGLTWTPRRPGAALLHDMISILFGAGAVLLLVGWTILRRSAVIVNELIASEARARELAYHDPLTGLPNRAMLFEQLPEMMAGLSEQRPLLGVMCIDLDRFKIVNDTLGHQAGDVLLRTVAERLRVLVDADERKFAARLGGDEFVLLAQASDRGTIERLAQRLLALLLAPIDSEFGRLDVGCSIGAALIEPSEADPSLALRQADLALYRAKARGRGCITFYEATMETALERRRKLEARLRLALDEASFNVVYQPQTDAHGVVRGYEALLRWTDSELGEIPPTQFIPLAEECGLILAIGEFVLRQVFAETRGWGGVRVAINVSAIQMRTPGFAARLMQMVAAARVDPSRFDIELTETALLADTPATAENFAAIRRMGFAIVLDDFGTGHSSLSLLHRFRVDKIKIDRSFVADLGECAEAETLVGAIVKLARAFHLDVIAEGVETEAQHEHLIAVGCESFQGWLSGHPVPAAQIDADVSVALSGQMRA